MPRTEALCRPETAQDNSTNFTVLSVATKETWKNKQTNEWESRTEWHRILVFGKLGDFATTLIRGAHIEVEGALRSREQTLELKAAPRRTRKLRTSGPGSFVPNPSASLIAPRNLVKTQAPAMFRSDPKCESGRTRPLSIALRLGAHPLHHADNYLGEFFRRLKRKLGKPEAVTATARKLAPHRVSLLTTRGGI